MSSNTPQVYVVIGASRGIGLEYIKQLSSRVPSPIIFAGVRSPSSSAELTQLASTNPNVHVVAADLSSTDSINAAAQHIGTQVDGVDVLIVNGAQFATGKVIDGAVQAIESLFAVNVLGPARAIHAFVPLLRKRNTKKIINISSTAGSITLNEAMAVAVTVHGPYSISKGALNILTRQAATELKNEGFIVVPLDPGGVSTTMAHQARDAGDEAFKQMFKALEPTIQTPTESVTKQLRIIDSLTVEQNGTFIGVDGKIIPW